MWSISRDAGIGRLLDLAGKPVVIVLADLVILFQLLDHVHGVAADMAHRDARGFGIFVRDLDQFLAPLLVQFGNAQADHLSFGRRRQAEIGVDDRLFDRMDQRAVPDIDRDQPRLRNAHGRHLIERHLRAIGVDHDRIEQMRGRAAGAQARQFGLQHGAGALHAALDLVDIVRCAFAMAIPRDTASCRAASNASSG